MVKLNWIPSNTKLIYSISFSAVPFPLGEIILNPLYVKDKLYNDFSG